MIELFLDAGQSAVRARLRNQDQVHNWTLPKIDTSRPVAQQIIDSVQLVYKESNEKPSRISISSTALSDQQHVAEQIFDFARKHGVQSLLLAHDSIGGYLASLGTNYGAVTAVGTGVVTLGVGPAGYSRVDGWGNIIGDAGSGFWLGRAAFDKALRAHDGRGQKTKLLDLISKSYPEIEDAYLQLQADQARVSKIASFAKDIIELSISDEVANDIVNDACDELVLSLSTALKNTGFAESDSPAVSWTGSVAKNPIISNLLRSKLVSLWPKVKIVESTADPIDGVELMGLLDETHPIRSKITLVGKEAV